MSEQAHPRAGEIDMLSTRELLELMHDEDRHAIEAVASQLDQIAAAVDAIAARLRAGGRLHYFGAGTSGRLAVLDAAEIPATFGVAPELVVAHAAGDGEGGGGRGEGCAKAFGRAVSYASARTDAGRGGKIAAHQSCRNDRWERTAGSVGKI